MNIQNKDQLYYNDLIYKIKSLSGLIKVEDPETEQRILDREELIGKIDENKMISYMPSMFQLDIFEIVRNISKKLNIPFKTLYEISKYPEEVNEVLHELQSINKLYTSRSKVKQRRI